MAQAVPHCLISEKGRDSIINGRTAQLIPHAFESNCLYCVLMRFPSIPTLIRTFHAFTNTTFRAANRGLYAPPQRATLIRSMPNIPFLGALFGTKMADNTQYPLQKTEGEWQAQLSPGTSLTRLHPCVANACAQSNFASSARKAPSLPALANSISTTLTPVSTHALAAMRRCTRQTTSLIPGAAGPPSGTPSQMLWASGQTRAWA